jgi:hypothetical protein
MLGELLSLSTERMWLGVKGASTLRNDVEGYASTYKCAFVVCVPWKKRLLRMFFRWLDKRGF